MRLLDEEGQAFETFEPIEKQQEHEAGNEEQQQHETKSDASGGRGLSPRFSR